MAEAFVPLSNLDFNQAIAPSPLLVSGETSLLDALMLMSRERAACALPADPAMQSDPVYPLLMENRASCVLVVQDEQLIGILTERDIVRLCASRRFSIETASSSGQTLLSEIQVAEVMTHPVMSVRRSQLTDVFVPLSLFRQHHIRHLPVLDEDGKILGLLTQNALRYLLRPIDLLRLRLVTEVMMTRVVCAYPTDSILHLTQLMANHRISSIVIVEEYPPPRIHPQIEAPNPLPENLPETLLDDPSEMPPLSFPVGIITERDIVQFQALGLDFEQIQAQTVMSTPVFAVSPNLSLWDAHLQMQQRRVSRTVVIGSQGELRGIITQTCVLSVLNPLEIYNLMEALEHRVSQLEAEKLEILQQRNAELERQVQERTSALQRQAERERLLRAIANHIRATLNLQETLNAIVLEVRQFLHCDRVFLYQFLPDWSGVIVADACRREERSLIGEKVHDRCFQNWIGTYAGGQYRVIEDVQTVDLAPCHREMLERLEVRAKVLMPVICDGTLWGLFLASEKDYPRQWQREEIDLLRQLSTQISIAIQQSAAYERLQSELAERQRREQELQLLYTLTQLISTAPDFRAALEVTLREICHFANWLCGEVWLPNPEQTYLRPGSSYSGCDGLSPGADSFFSLSKTFTFEQNQGLPGRVWATQQPEWILNISQENAECFLRLDAAQEMGLRTACGIPILTNEKVVAVLVFFSIEEREQNAEFLNLIQSIANQLGQTVRRKQTEAALRQSEAINRAIVQAIPDLLIRVNRHGRYLGMTSGGNLQEVLLTSSEIKNSTIYDILPPDLAEQRTIAMQAAFATEEPQTYEQAIELRGKLCWEEIRIIPYSPDELLVMIRDITDRKQAEEALRESEAKNRAILAAIPDLMFRVDEDGVYLGYVTNNRSFDLLPASINPTGKRMEAVLPSEVAKRQRYHLRRALATSQLQVYEQQFQMGDRLQYEEVRVVRSGEAEVLFMIRDIGDRKRAEAALRHSEATNRAIIQAIPDLLIRMKRDGQYQEILCHGSVNVILAPEGIEHPTIFDILPYETAIKQVQAAQQALDTQLLQIYEQEIEIKGVQRYEEVRVAPLTEDEVLIIVRDVSDRKQAEFALRQLNQELEDRVERRTAALRASEERWQLALQSSNAAIWDWDVRANKTFRSTRWKELRGYQEAEIGTDTQEWQDYIHPDDRDRILAAIADHIARKTPFYQEEYRILRKDGSYLWILDRAQGLWDEAGNLIRMVGSEIDITPRKLAELEARSLRERLEFLLSASPAVIYTCEPFSPYRITFISDNIAVLSGYPPSEFLLESRFWLDHIHPDDRDRLMLESDPLYEQGYHCHEYRFLHQEGKYCWFRSELKLIRDSAGNPLEVVGYLADITDRKTVELALQESEAKLQLFVQYAPAAVAMFDRKMRYLAASNRWKQDYQLGDRQIIGHSHYEIFPDIPEQWRAAYQRCLAGAVETCEEDSFYRPDGTIEWLRWELRPWYRADGRIGGIVLLTEIITERKQAQEQLRNLSDRLKLAIQSGAIGIWEWDIVNDVLTWDDRMYELYGISRSTFSGAYEAWRNGLHPDDRIVGETAIQAALRGEKEFDTEFRVIWADQSIHFIKASALVQRNQQGEPVRMVGINFDITKRRRAEEQLRQSNQKLEQATRLKDEFLANMSHELRTPLNAILGMSEGLQEQVFGSLNERQLKAIATIERSGRHLLELINDILDLSKIESGKLELELSPVSVRNLCDASLSFVRQMAHQKRIRLTSAIPDALDLIQVDDRRIRQVLINLLSNAVKFTPEGGSVILEVWTPGALLAESPYPLLNAAQQTALQQAIAPSNTCFSVLDTGIGIAAADLGKLFQTFVQIDSRLNRQHAGTGLGLALVRRIVELHGGTVWVESEVGRGSCFTICLPNIARAQKLSLTDSPSYPTCLLSPENNRVLVIEDSVAAADQIIRYLNEVGMEASSYVRGEGAIAEILRVQPTLVILDLQLPNVSGWEVLAQIKAHPEIQQIPVIITSVVDDRARGLSLGASDYLVKPITRAQFHAALEQLRQPNATTPPANRTDPLLPVERKPDPARSPLILLAEDNEMNVVTISNYLNSKGYRLLFATNGREAIAQAQAHQPDLILMDVQMPHIDGIEATQQIRAIPALASTPIIALTALAMEGDRDRCLAAGANDYLAKPVRLKQLVERIESLL